MKEKQNSICLRPHHGMCLAYFEGRGYSREFAEHMGKILDIMERDARVSLTVGGDVICSACPNLKGQVCVTADQVAEYDRKVLLLLSLIHICTGRTDHSGNPILYKTLEDNRRSFDKRSDRNGSGTECNKRK